MRLPLAGEEGHQFAHLAVFTLNDSCGIKEQKKRAVACMGASRASRAWRDVHAAGRCGTVHSRAGVCVHTPPPSARPRHRLCARLSALLETALQERLVSERSSVEEVLREFSADGAKETQSEARQRMLNLRLPWLNVQES